MKLHMALEQTKCILSMNSYPVAITTHISLVSYKIINTMVIHANRLSLFLPDMQLYMFRLAETSEKILKWSDRLAILIGVAKAVHFLHTGLIPGFFSNRLKTHNVLLNEHQMAKLSDYGLSIVADENDKPEVSSEKIH